MGRIMIDGDLTTSSVEQLDVGEPGLSALYPAGLTELQSVELV